MISWTIPVDQTVSPQTVIERTTYRAGETTVGEDNQGVNGNNGASVTQYRSYVTQANGNTYEEYFTESAASGSLTDSINQVSENTEIETIYRSYVSSETNGSVYAGTVLAELALVGAPQTREGSMTTGTQETILPRFGNRTATTETSTRLWSNTVSNEETSFFTYSASTTAKTTVNASYNLVSSTTGSATFTENGMDDRFPTYASATVISLAPNEVAWVASTTSGQLGPLSNVASSFTGVSTIYPLFFTFPKAQSNIYDEIENSNIVAPNTNEQNITYSAVTANVGIPITRIVPQNQIPFLEQSLNSFRGVTAQLTSVYGPQGVAEGGTFTKGRGTAIGVRVAKRTAINNGVSAETVRNIPATQFVAFTIGGEIGNMGASGTTTYSDSLIEDGDNSNKTFTSSQMLLIESTGDNTHPYALSVWSPLEPARFEKEYYFGAAAFNKEIGSNVNLPLTIKGVELARLSQTAFVPAPFFYSATINDEAGLVTIGENVTVKRGSQPTESYELELIGEPLTTIRSPQRAGLRGGNSPIAHTLFLDAGGYETFAQNGQSGTTFYSDPTSFSATEGGVVNHRAIPVAIAAVGAGQRFLVQTYATTTTGTFF
jgi:hypothetical protein